MKISGAVIQNRNIAINTDERFDATYKGREIYITTDHGHGHPKYNHLNRYDIVVIVNGSYEVNTWEDCHTMKDAIRFALKGACLLPKPSGLQCPTGEPCINEKFCNEKGYCLRCD